jgi:hypothetical protein
MNVAIGTKAAQFQEKEYIIGIFVAVHCACLPVLCTSQLIISFLLRTSTFPAVGEKNVCFCKS